jgi:hypothetical protein
MKNWYKITEKLAPINKPVMVLDPKHNRIKEGFLRVCENTDFLKKYTNNIGLKTGDIYWLVTELRNDTDHNSEKNAGTECIGDLEEFPYWMETKKLIEISTIAEIGIAETNRLEILDL